ncbi:MAG: hypothetical protein E5V74_10995 [Mesorhizobium sp.]|nr:MAG: hypothetical protein E5V86_03450 [Mesorhizobium sp.]TIW02714.1 MAG: hypothetical protein E5V74_10995 [Mesorhizobium sp.]
MWEQPSAYLKRVDHVEIIISKNSRKLEYLIEGSISPARLYVVENESHPRLPYVNYCTNTYSGDKVAPLHQILVPRT